MQNAFGMYYNPGLNPNPNLPDYYTDIIALFR